MRIKIKNKYCFFDDPDIAKVNWWMTDNGYAVREVMENGIRKRILMHHLVLPRKKGVEIDHINGNKLDNRSSNLRYATRSQNNMNRKSSKGYRFNKRERKWKAYIKKDGTMINLGTFSTSSEAIIARREAEKTYFKEYANEKSIH